MDTQTTLEKIRNWNTYLGRTIVKRDQEIHALWAAAISGHHVAFLGPPGEAKSLLARSFAKALSAHCYEYLFTRYTKPDELFGPLDLAAFKQGVYKHKTENTLVDSRVAFLDEAFKANSGILNALLGILNERKFNNGNERQDVPLEFAILASNELPVDECSALWDRCLVRFMIEQLENDDINALLHKRNSPVKPPEPITAEEMQHLRELAAEMPVNCPREMKVLMEELDKEGINPSTRRWAWAMDYLRAHAVLEGKSVVDANMFKHLNNVLWTAPQQKPVIEAIVAKIKPIPELLADSKPIIEKAFQLAAEFTKSEPGTRAEAAKKLITGCDELKKELDVILPRAKKDGNKEVLEALEKALTFVTDAKKKAIEAIAKK